MGCRRHDLIELRAGKGGHPQRCRRAGYVVRTEPELTVRVVAPALDASRRDRASVLESGGDLYRIVHVLGCTVDFPNDTRGARVARTSAANSQLTRFIA